ncbi:MAG: phenylalanine--tRNA ligase subunit beta [Oscillospiraceae bacterium]|nr:phenylalanine--tRNA ligase subunit beta [Oscillospiraceae bacterium]
MKTSIGWLCEFTDIENIPVRDFAEGMTMSGSKVEGYAVEGAELENIVVGKVLSAEKHPGADSVFICKVDVGQNTPVQIVTGADNVTAGALVPAALDGAVVHGGKKIKTGKLRGELSEGMLCSIGELGLTPADFPGSTDDGIFILEEDLQPGQAIQKAIGLDQVVVEFEITSNRPDCLSVIGLAREASATFDKPFTVETPAVKAGAGDIGGLLSVTVENTELCSRYSAAAVKNVKIAPSPRWMRERLRACGVRPINNIVDITNYVMLEYGHPMHAFDLRHVNGGKIIVRNAEEGESITTLDGTQRSLSTEMLVIADEKSPSAVAGVMGGEYSGIYGDTQIVIFESACFSGPSVRMTAKKLGMRTESSGRFEKGLDPENAMKALMRACELVELLGAGEVCDGFIDVRTPPREPVKIPLDCAWINAFLGSEIPESEIISILRKLEFTVEGGVVTVPSFRGDVSIKADLAEETARIYGYNNIPSAPLQGCAEGVVAPEQNFELKIAGLLQAQGHYEIITYSFINPKSLDKIGLPQDDAHRNCVVILNPLSEETSVMRTTGMPSMLDVLSRNYRGRIPSARLYELAACYIPTEEGKLPFEVKVAVLGAYGGGVDFYTVKAAVDAVLEGLGIEAEYSAVDNMPIYHPGRAAVITAGGENIGTIGEVHPTVCENYEIGGAAYLAELSIPMLMKHSVPDILVKPLPKFPASTRDLALVADEDLPVGEIKKAVTAAAGELLEGLELFDIYRGRQVAEGKKSVAYSLTLRAADRTLTDEECDRLVQKILDKLSEIGVGLRR